ncbi:hypothetical protein K443DRAFT_7343 [Laccaria amethystina LaAM-08-1]|jgi:hypothetical protein|uniref:Uncharacterized protein n=1 Tax=Laccaria amethystina LaAM-08-1 TaxID=1095629 RepID=A0A0C9XYC1_9AGAR|nr:hypothetical protein K443DRAFT_7343 [Laccaria amethystina LaAM-08-1]
MADWYVAALPDNIPSSNRSAVAFREAFKNARLRFTHFARASDPTGVITNAMWAAYVQGLALTFIDEHRPSRRLHYPRSSLGCVPLQHVMNGMFTRFKPGLSDLTEGVSQFFNASGD